MNVEHECHCIFAKYYSEIMGELLRGNDGGQLSQRLSYELTLLRAERMYDRQRVTVIFLYCPHSSDLCFAA